MPPRHATPTQRARYVNKRVCESTKCAVDARILNETQKAIGGDRDGANVTVSYPKRQPRPESDTAVELCMLIHKYCQLIIMHNGMQKKKICVEY